MIKPYQKTFAYTVEKFWDEPDTVKNIEYRRRKFRKQVLGCAGWKANIGVMNRIGALIEEENYNKFRFSGGQSERELFYAQFMCSSHR